MEAQVILKQGVVRRVGIGETVDALKDPWLPDAEDPFVHTNHEAIQNKIVDVLMTQARMNGTLT